MMEWRLDQLDEIQLTNLIKCCQIRNMKLKVSLHMLGYFLSVH